MSDWRKQIYNVMEKENALLARQDIKRQIQIAQLKDQIKELKTQLEGDDKC